MTTLTQGSLKLRLEDDGNFYPSNDVTLIFKFRTRTDSPCSSLDLSDLVEFRTELRQDGDLKVRDDDLSLVFSTLKYDELEGLVNLEKVQVGMYPDLEDFFRKTQQKLSDFIEACDLKKGKDYLRNTLDVITKRSEPLRDCNHRYQLNITLGGFPLDNLRAYQEARDAESEEDRGTERIERVMETIEEAEGENRKRGD